MLAKISKNTREIKVEKNTAKPYKNLLILTENINEKPKSANSLVFKDITQFSENAPSSNSTNFNSFKFLSCQGSNIILRKVFLPQEVCKIILFIFHLE